MRYLTIAGLLCGAGVLWALAGRTQAQDDREPPRVQQERESIQLEGRERVQPAQPGVQPRRPGAVIEGEVEGRVQPRPGIAVEGEVQSSEFYKASEIIGMTVQGADGQPIGRVKDLMIDGRTEQIRYLILEGGETLQAEGKLFVLPWVVVQPNFTAEAPAERFIAVEIDRQRLLQAPTVTEVQFRSGRDVAWVTEVDAFFQVDALRSRRTLRPGADGRIDGDARPGQRRPGARRDQRPGARPDQPGADRPGADRPDADRPGAARPGARPGADQPGARPRTPRPGAGTQPGARPGAGTQPGARPGAADSDRPGAADQPGSTAQPRQEPAQPAETPPANPGAGENP